MYFTLTLASSLKINQTLVHKNYHCFLSESLTLSHMHAAAAVNGTALSA